MRLNQNTGLHQYIIMCNVSWKTLTSMYGNSALYRVRFVLEIDFSPWASDLNFCRRWTEIPRGDYTEREHETSMQLGVTWFDTWAKKPPRLHGRGFFVRLYLIPNQNVRGRNNHGQQTTKIWIIADKETENRKGIYDLLWRVKISRKNEIYTLRNGGTERSFSWFARNAHLNEPVAFQDHVDEYCFRIRTYLGQTPGNVHELRPCYVTIAHVRSLGVRRNGPTHLYCRARVRSWVFQNIDVKTSSGIFWFEVAGGVVAPLPSEVRLLLAIIDVSWTIHAVLEYDIHSHDAKGPQSVGFVHEWEGPPPIVAQHLTWHPRLTSDWCKWGTSYELFLGFLNVLRQPSRTLFQTVCSWLSLFFCQLFESTQDRDAV